MVSYVGERFAGKTIGVIGTKRTINSNVYQKKIDKLGKNIHLKTLATPLLAPMIEEGFYDNSVSDQIIHQYLSDSKLDGIEALILGCTHYPLIKRQITEFYNNTVQVIDSSDIVAAHLKAYLVKNNLLNESSEKSTDKFFVSDYTRSFAESTKIFFKESVNLEYYPLWD